MTHVNIIIQKWLDNKHSIRWLERRSPNDWHQLSPIFVPLSTFYGVIQNCKTSLLETFPESINIEKCHFEETAVKSEYRLQAAKVSKLEIKIFLHHISYFYRLHV